MPVVDKLSNAYDFRDANDQQLNIVDTILNRAQVRCAIGTVAPLASDNNGSKYRLWRMPSHAILRAETRLKLQGWGYAAATVGVMKPDGTVLTSNGLLASTTISGVSAPVALITVFDSKWGKRLWEQAGLSADPGGLLDVFIGTAADATGTGAASFDAVWQID